MSKQPDKPEPKEGQVKPQAMQHYLDELIAGITPQNQHQEIDFGRPVGQEKV